MKSFKKNFLGLKTNDLKKARIVIVPFGFEASATYGKGARNGPAAIIEASTQVELFDEEFWEEIYKKIKISTMRDYGPIKTFNQAKRKAEQLILKFIKNKQLPVILGGEHSITPFIVEAYQKSGVKNFSILQFDAHADLRDGYLGERYSHAAAMRRCLDLKGINIVQVGIRNISDEDDELKFWSKNQKRIATFWAKDKDKWQIHKLIKALKNDVYISFDVDCLDSGIMPSTGTPEPGGLNWYEVLDIMKVVCRNKKIIGADFVELAPIKNLEAPNFLVAKLIYKMIGYLNLNKRYD